MADKTISQLPSGVPPQANDEYIVARGAANYKLTLGNILGAPTPIGSVTPNTATFTTVTATTGNITTVDIDSGAIDGTIIGGAVAAAGTFTTLGATTGNITTVNATTVDATNVEVTNVKAKDGTAAITIADSTGAVTIDAGATINGGAVFNETGADVDFRIESDTNADAFALDGTNGNVGIGTAPVAVAKVIMGGTLPNSGTSSQGFRSIGQIPSATTGGYIGFFSFPTTEAASFTLAGLSHFTAGAQPFGAGSTVTSQIGFEAASSLTGATNNYGFYSAIASGSGRWGFYSAGTAANYFAGNTGVGAASGATIRLRVKGADTTASSYTIYADNSASTVLFYALNNGQISTGTAASSPYNYTSGSAANVYVDSSGILYRSTSSLRYKSDVADATHGLVDVLKLRSVTYKAKNSGDTVFGGLIAEEVHDAGLTEFVVYDKENRPDALHYGNMVALLVKAVQELKAELDTLKGNV